MELVGLRLRESKKLNQVAAKHIQQSWVPDDTRDRLALKAADYAIELHGAIVTLIEDKMFGASGAMARLLIEACLSGVYILHCVPIEKAELMESGQLFLPKHMSEMVKACQEIPNIGPMFKALGSTSMAPFHKLTHGDMPQLNRRLLRETAFHEGYTPHEIETQLVLANTLLLAAMEIAAVASARPDYQSHVRKLRIDMLDEIKQAFGLAGGFPDVPLPEPIRP